MKNTTATVSSIMAITLLGKVLGLWRDRLLVISYGTGMEANAFYTASRIPRVFFDSMFASAVALCLIPVFGKTLQKQGEKKAYDFAGNFISVLSAVTFVMTVVGIFFAPQLVELFATGYDSETKVLTISLTRVLFPTVFMTGIAFSFVGILQGREKFVIPALLSTVSNGIIILYFYLGNLSYGIYGLAVAYLIGWGAQAGMQIPSLRKLGYRYRPDFSVKSPEMKQVFALMLPVMVSTWVAPINLTVNTRFASTLYQGAGVSILEISTNLYLMIAGIFILSLTNVIFPRLSTQSADDFKETMRETLHISLFFTLPMSLGLAVVAEPLIGLFYGGGAFGPEEIVLTGKALSWVSLGMVGFGVQNIISRGFFAKEDGKAPLVAGLCSVFLNLILCVLLVEVWAVEGLAIASALSSTVYGLVLLFALEKKEKGILIPSLGKDFLKMLFSAMAMAVIAKYVLAFSLGYGKVIALCLTAVFGGGSYFLLAYLLKLPEMMKVMNKE